MLQAALARWSKKKAPGIDGWSTRELKDWPLRLLALFTKLYKVVGKVYRWPLALEHSMVAMLTKGGSDDPEDRRPIVLLSVIYRLWACIRAATMRAWLARAGMLRAKGSGCAADWQ
eukprot:12609277-Heterocapsa_arctica.AAC.1